MKGADINTSHFTGNFPPAASARRRPAKASPTQGPSGSNSSQPGGCRGNAHHFVEIDDGRSRTHLRVNIFPDGGVARLRVYGQPACDWDRRDPDALVEVSALASGGRVVAYSNTHSACPPASSRRAAASTWETAGKPAAAASPATIG